MNGEVTVKVGMVSAVAGLMFLLVVGCRTDVGVGYSGVRIGDRPDGWSAERKESLGVRFHGEPVYGGVRYRDMWMDGDGEFGLIHALVDGNGEIVELTVYDMMAARMDWPSVRERRRNVVREMRDLVERDYPEGGVVVELVNADGENTEEKAYQVRIRRQGRMLTGW